MTATGEANLPSTKLPDKPEQSNPQDTGVHLVDLVAGAPIPDLHQRGNNAEPIGGTNGATIDSSGNISFGEILHGIENVGAQVLKGAANEVTEHPGSLLRAAAIGAGIGGAAMAFPVIEVGLGVAGAAYGAYELYEHLPGWIHDAKVTAEPDQYSKTEVNEADQDLQAIGAGATDIAVSGLFAGAGGYVGAMSRKFLSPALTALAVSMAPETVKAIQAHLPTMLSSVAQPMPLPPQQHGGNSDS